MYYIDTVIHRMIQHRVLAFLYVYVLRSWRNYRLFADVMFYKRNHKDSQVTQCRHWLNTDEYLANTKRLVQDDCRMLFSWNNRRQVTPLHAKPRIATSTKFESDVTALMKMGAMAFDRSTIIMLRPSVLPAITSATCLISTRCIVSES